MAKCNQKDGFKGGDKMRKEEKKEMKKKKKR